jgi:hypothetical protein
MMLLICPVRPGDSNEELRYALRSWETNLHLGGDLRLLVVGDKPTWCDPDLFIKGNQTKSMPFNVWDNVRTGAVEAASLREAEAVYMNDDFFCLDPTGCILPVRRNATLAAHVASAGASSALWWPKSLALTASWLAGAGFPHPWSYEVHRPLFCKPERMVWALDQWDGPMDGALPQWRTMYGVLNKVEAYPVVDAKLSRRSTGVGTPWVSTSDSTWRIYANAIKKRFQKPSRWEKS